MRNYAAALAFGVFGCGGRTEEDVDLANNLPPWHMWGNGQTVVVPHSIAIIQNVTSQLARISYGRPESWHFMFSARIIDSTDITDVGELTVDWNLVIGVGRAQSTIESFQQFHFLWPALTNPIGMHKYCTSTLSPATDDLFATSTLVIDSFVAQDIQLNATLSHTAGAVPIKSVTVELDCFFSPITHVRPEWYKCDFRGDEDHGS